MKTWEEIVNKALLGSEKAPLSAADLPEVVAARIDMPTTGEREDTFFKISALGYQFRQSGSQPINLTTIVQAEAMAETRPYCTAAAQASLKEILGEDLPKFLELWLRLCSDKGQIVHPEIIPSLFAIAERKKELRQRIIDVAGKRGEWLAGLNPEWQFFATAVDGKEIWETGTPEQRREALATLRLNKPDEGRALLESTWPGEGANDKIAFLDIMKIGSSASDLPWLESLKEKGQKVSNAILDLLKMIPASAVVREYQSVLSQSTSVKTGKALLGMISKSELIIDESFPFPETIFKTGIEKLSSDKKVSDQQYILVQLISSVPPAFWNQHLQRPPSEIIDLFFKERHTAFYLPALAIAAVRFNDLEWIRMLLDKADDVVLAGARVSLIGALDAHERDRFAIKFLKDRPAEIVQLMISGHAEWSAELTKAILKYTAGEIYHYNKSFYRAAASLMHVSVLGALDSFSPSEDQKKLYWNNQRDELARLLTIKQQTLQSFNA